MGDRRIAWAAMWTVGEALARQRSSGRGLRGGAYPASSGQFTFEEIGFVRSLGVSGTATYDRTALTSNLTVDGLGRRDGTLSISFATGVPDAAATITGEIAGRAVELTTAAPWATRP